MISMIAAKKCIQPAASTIWTFQLGVAAIRRRPPTGASEFIGNNGDHRRRISFKRLARTLFIWSSKKFCVWKRRPTRHVLRGPLYSVVSGKGRGAGLERDGAGGLGGEAEIISFNSFHLLVSQWQRTALCRTTTATLLPYRVRRLRLTTIYDAQSAVVKRN